MDRKTMKLKRKQLLKNFDKLSKARCEKCINSQSNLSNIADVMKCKCDAAVEIRKIGKQLDKLISPRVWREKMDEIKKNREISVLDYLWLAEQGVTDVLIAAALKTNEQRLRDWKKSRGINQRNRANPWELARIKAECGHDILKTPKAKRSNAKKVYSDDEIEYVVSSLRLKSIKDLSMELGVSMWEVRKIKEMAK